MRSIERLRSASQAAVLLAHPLRTRILASAREPISAADLARRLGEPRQKVSYHVRQLARAGLLERVGRQRKRNMIEQQLQASAAGYVLTTALLAEAAASTDAAPLVEALARGQEEVARLTESAEAAGVRVRTVALERELRFRNAEERAAFTRTLFEAVNGVVSKYNSQGEAAGAAGQVRPYRLLLACYPLPG